MKLLASSLLKVACLTGWYGVYETLLMLISVFPLVALSLFDKLADWQVTNTIVLTTEIFQFLNGFESTLGVTLLSGFHFAIA